VASAAFVVAKIAVATVRGFGIPASVVASAMGLASRGSPSQVEVATGAGLRTRLGRIAGVTTGKLEAGIFFLSYFKGPSSQDQQKTFSRGLITFKVTLTGQSHFMLFFVLRKVTLCSRTNSVQ
jgi:hypothetical protein